MVCKVLNYRSLYATLRNVIDMNILKPCCFARRKNICSVIAGRRWKTTGTWIKRGSFIITYN